MILLLPKFTYRALQEFDLSPLYRPYRLNCVLPLSSSPSLLLLGTSAQRLRECVWLRIVVQAMVVMYIVIRNLVLVVQITTAVYVISGTQQINSFILWIKHKLPPVLAT